MPTKAPPKAKSASGSEPRTLLSPFASVRRTKAYSDAYIATCRDGGHPSSAQDAGRLAIEAAERNLDPGIKTQLGAVVVPNVLPADVGFVSQGEEE
jgi:hypothetical protein